MVWWMVYMVPQGSVNAYAKCVKHALWGVLSVVG